MTSYPEHIETPVARLDRWDFARDTAGWAALCGDPEVMRFLGGPVPEEESETVSTRLGEHWERYGFGLWAVRAPEGGECLGFAGICHPLWHPEYIFEVEVGWRLAREAWGRGYASTGGRAGLEAGFGELSLTEIIAFFDYGNTRSLAVSGRLGMTRVGESAEPRSGKPLAIHRITANEFAARAADGER